MSTEDSTMPRRDASGRKTEAWTKKLIATQNVYIDMVNILRNIDENMRDAYQTALDYADLLLASRNDAEDSEIEKCFRAQFQDVEWVEKLPSGGSVISREELRSLTADIKRVGTPTKCLVMHVMGLVTHDLEGGDAFDKAFEKEEKEKQQRTDGKYVADFEVPDYKQQRDDEIARMLEEVRLADLTKAENVK